MKLGVGLLLLLLVNGKAMAAKDFTIGDSQSAFVHAGWVAGQSWGSLVAAGAGFTEVPLAVAGYTTAQMQSQWDYVLANYVSGDAVEVMAGANDINVTPPAVFKATLDGQIAAAIAAGIPANRITLHTPFILLEPVYQKAAFAYLQAIREVAVNRGVPLVDVWAHFSELSQAGISLTQFYAPNDTQHESPLGHAEIRKLHTLPQNAASASFQQPAAPYVIGAPIVVTAPLHQTAESGPTLLSAQVSYLDPGGVSATRWNVQDYNAPGGEVALQLDGGPFPCSNSTTVTADVFSRLKIVPVAHSHDIWVSSYNGVFSSSGVDFSVTPP